MTLQDFKYSVLKQGFQITEIGKYVVEKDTYEEGDFQIHTRVDLRDSDGLNWYRELIIPEDMYGSQDHINSLKEAIDEIYNRYSIRQTADIYECSHERIIVLDGKYLCIECKAKIEGKVPLNLKNLN